MTLSKSQLKRYNIWKAQGSINNMSVIVTKEMLLNQNNCSSTTDVVVDKLNYDVCMYLLGRSTRESRYKKSSTKRNVELS